jgi:hypothetical protein
MNADTLYHTDNGRILCRNHLGYTAQTTGRDLSGQRIQKLSPRDRREYRDALGYEIECETCRARKGA